MLKKIIRPEILAMPNYVVPNADGFIKLDAMENPFTLPADLQQALAKHLSALPLHRYPVPSYDLLKQNLAEHFSIPNGFKLMLGNGSDELISLLALACAKPGAKMLIPAPGFVMYKMAALIAQMETVEVPLTENWQLDTEAMLKAINQHQPALLFIAYPNNPTGALFDTESILQLFQAMQNIGLVIIDEAYQPFAGKTLSNWLPRFPHLILMRTLSKLGLAGIRLGYLSAENSLLEALEKIRPPYNVNVLTEASALFMMQHLSALEQQAAEICQERERVMQALTKIEEIQPYPSDANFILIRVQNADALFAYLWQHGILIKNVSKMHYLLQNCLRITIGTPQQNAMLLNTLQQFFKESTS